MSGSLFLVMRSTHVTCHRFWLPIVSVVYSSFTGRTESGSRLWGRCSLPFLTLLDLGFHRKLMDSLRSPYHRLPFPSIVVASTDDIYASLNHAQRSAAEWGSELIMIGAVGHINAESGLDQWKEGWDLVQRMLQRSEGMNESA